ncbi:hypothetical protein OIU76_020852 [Salix suchowensis]|nr:hypothetical protein OIU76_020852 [Salix suchowensis]
MSCGCFGISNWFKGNKNKNTSGQTNTEISTDNVNLFSYNSLRSATRSFHPSNRIGGGGFGVVYKVSRVSIA